MKKSRQRARKRIHDRAVRNLAKEIEEEEERLMKEESEDCSKNIGSLVDAALRHEATLVKHLGPALKAEEKETRNRFIMAEKAFQKCATNPKAHAKVRPLLPRIRRSKYAGTYAPSLAKYAQL